MAIRKIETIQSLSELNISDDTLRTLEATNVSAEDLVAATRNDVLWKEYLPSQAHKPAAHKLMRIPGIGKSRAAEIVAAVDEAGFLLHESDLSRNARRLLALILKSPHVYEETYESLEEVSVEGLREVDNIISRICPKRFVKAVRLYYGLEDGHCYSAKECASKTGSEPEVVKLAAKNIVSKLRHSNHTVRLKVAVLYSHDALAKQMASLKETIRNCQLELKALREASPYPDL